MEFIKCFIKVNNFFFFQIYSGSQFCQDQMKRQLNKANSTLNANRKVLGSSKNKRPPQQLPGLSNASKKPFLKQYSTAMQQKLQSLKDKISEKKKQKNKDESSRLEHKGLSSNFQNFLKSNTAKDKNIQTKLARQQFLQFLSKINLSSYKNLFFQNQIDTLQILSEATPKQLQEIGITKGHCLKINANLSKYLKKPNPSRIKKENQPQGRESKTKDSQRSTSFVAVNMRNKEQESSEVKSNHNQTQKVMDSICVGTENDGLEQIKLTSNKCRPQKHNFCLFCYQSVKTDTNMQTKTLQQQNGSQCPPNVFCSEECSDRYDQIFKKYENNLVKAQQQFKKPPSSQKQSIIRQQQNDSKNSQDQSDQDEHDGLQFDILAENLQPEDFDYEQYESLKRQLGQI